MQRDMIPMAFLAVVLAAAVGAALWMTGGPNAGRAEQYDAKRFADLYDLNRYVECASRVKGGVLIESLEVVEACGDPFDYRDPLTGEPYRYEKLSAQSYRLCADFQRPNASSIRRYGGTFDAAAECIIWTYRF